jgi:hypothetical protein
MKKPGKTIELATSAQIAAWRQRLDSENKICHKQNQREIETMLDKMDQKNTYMHYFKKEEIKAQDKHLEETKNYFQYDMARGDTSQDYCQKCKSESKWCKHRKQREEFKGKLAATLTSA